MYMKENKFLKPSTVDAYNSMISTHISKISQIKTSKLSKVKIQQWINDMEGISPKTIRNVYGCLSAIMKWATTMDLISNNPCQNIKLPKKENKEAVFYTNENVQLLKAKLEMLPQSEMKYKVAIYIALFGGLRKAEILGLNWDDFDGKTLKIHRTRMIRRGEGVYENTPKTAKSCRLITLPSEVCLMLNQLKKQQEDELELLGIQPAEACAILQGDGGKPLYPQVLQRWFTRFVSKNDLPEITLHGLRHTHTSMLTSLQLDTKQISERLGHSQLSTTMNIYTHLFKKDDGIAEELSKQFLH